MHRFHTFSMPPIRHSRGFSLVEIMIASTIGLMLLAAIIGLFLSSNHTSKETMMRGGLYENGRYALFVLADELRSVDFWGGVMPVEISASTTLDAITTDCSGMAMGYNLTASLWAMTANTADAIDCIDDAKINSDILVVKHVAPSPTPIAAIDASLTYIMSSYAAGVLFDGSDTPPTTSAGGNVPGGQPWQYLSTIYYVSDNADGIPTLYRKRLIGNQWQAKEEVAMGIERLHLQFGVDSTGDGIADSFRDAATTDWPNTVAARVFLLVRSENANPSFTDKKTYRLGDVIIDSPNDHYHRLVFDTSINLRNRKLIVAGGF